MKKMASLLLFLMPVLCLAQPSPRDDAFLKTYPHLKQYVYEEPKSNFYLGMGLSPVGLLRDRFMFAASLFEVHWIESNWDIEMLNATYGFTRAQASNLQSTHFTLYTLPKYRIFGSFSVGPMLGYESVTFPGVSSELYNNGLNTKPQPFSSRGFIYGVGASQNIGLNGGYLMKVSEVIYKETYSTEHTPQNWRYIYMDKSVQADRTKIGAATVMMVNVSFLY